MGITPHRHYAKLSNDFCNTLIINFDTYPCTFLFKQSVVDMETSDSPMPSSSTSSSSTSSSSSEEDPFEDAAESLSGIDDDDDVDTMFMDTEAPTRIRPLSKFDKKDHKFYKHFILLL